MTTTAPVDEAAPVRATDIAAEVTAALVAGWDSIRARHPQVPDAIISMGTGGRDSLRMRAHFAANRWRVRTSGSELHEVFITAESLQDGAAEVFASLLHEAAHALCEERGIDDCSASQYHNARFRDAAAEVGLSQDPTVSAYFRKKLGFSATVMPAHTEQCYATQIAELDAAIVATRQRPVPRLNVGAGGGGRTRGPGTQRGFEDELGAVGEQDFGARRREVKEDRNYARAVCACEPPTVIRISPSSLKCKTVMCATCTTLFTAPDGAQ